MKRNIFIGGAWPYANNSLHAGHLAGLMAGDVLARYHRLNGDNVCYVSGTDCHGTPITERAREEKVNPRDISNKYHTEFAQTFKDLAFSYDLYTKTDDEFHETEVKRIFKKIYDRGFIYEKIEPQPYCEHCKKFLADRELSVICPNCRTEVKLDEDSCNKCGYIFTPKDVEVSKCRICGNQSVLKNNKNLYLALSKFQNEVVDYVNARKANWRVNAQNETDKYLKQGLPDRAATRDLDWGVEVPVKGYENKRIYVWIEAVLGYLTACKKICAEKGIDWHDFWHKNDTNTISYYVHGKDNIPFHSIIFPVILMATGEEYHLPDYIVSSEFMTFNSVKMSKSLGNGILAKNIAKDFGADSFRYYLVKNGPEKKDTDFSMEDFKATHNNEINNKLGNFVNRTLKFKGITELPNGILNLDVKAEIEKAYKEISVLIERLDLREAVVKAMALVDYANKFYDEQKPWTQAKEDINSFNNTIFTCATIAANLGIIFDPFMPIAAAKIREYLNISVPKWQFINIKSGIDVTSVKQLFTKIQ